jgi:protein-disulfide isomerase
VLALALGCPQPQTTEPDAGEVADPTPAASLDGETITLGELDTWLKEELFAKATKNGDPSKLYELRSKGLDDMINERLVAREAEPLGITAEELADQEAAKRSTVSDEEVLAFFEDNKERMGETPFEDVAPRIRQHLEQRRRKEGAEEYISELRESASIEIFIDAPRVDVAAKGPSIGPEDAPVTIIEFSDYQCPYCTRAEAVVKQILERYPNEVRFIYRHFPLDRIHPQARGASEAAACAHEQGKFWEFHRKLFSPEAEYDTESLAQYASEVGLDMEAFQLCVDERRYQADIETDVADGRAAGVAGTPAFFVNGIIMKGARPLEDFVSLIEKELERTRG